MDGGEGKREKGIGWGQSALIVDRGQASNLAAPIRLDLSLPPSLPLGPGPLGPQSIVVCREDY